MKIVKPVIDKSEKVMQLNLMASALNYDWIRSSRITDPEIFIRLDSTPVVSLEKEDLK
jgi:hypothetical protein